MIPYPQPMRVWLEMFAEPVAGGQEFPFSCFTMSLAKEVVVAQSPLRNRDWVVLQSDLSVVVEQRNAREILRSLVIRLLGKQHVVFAKPMDTRVRICLRPVVPE